MAAFGFAEELFLNGMGNEEKVKALIATYADRIDLIRRAAHRQTCKAPPARVVRGHTHMTDNSLSNVRVGVALSIAKARFRVDAGDGNEALDLLTDAYLTGRDMAGTRVVSSGEIGITFMQHALDEVGETLKRRSLDEGQLRELERRLSLLDQYALDNSPMLQDHLLQLGEKLLDPSSPWWLQTDGRRWRYFFSTQLQAGSVFARTAGIVRQALPLERIQWADAQPVLLALRNEVDNDAMLCIASPDLVYAQHSRYIRPLLRAYAIAAHYLATGDVASAESPYGGPIHTRLTQEFLHLWTRTDFNTDDPEAPEDFRAITKNLKLRMKLKIPVRR